MRGEEAVKIIFSSHPFAFICCFQHNIPNSRYDKCSSAFICGFRLSQTRWASIKLLDCLPNAKIMPPGHAPPSTNDLFKTIYLFNNIKFPPATNIMMRLYSTFGCAFFLVVARNSNLINPYTYNEGVVFFRTLD